MPPEVICISWGLSVCFVFLIFITDSFLLSIVGSKLRVMTPSARNSEIPSLDRFVEPIGSSEVIIEVDPEASNAFIMKRRCLLRIGPDVAGVFSSESTKL